MTQKKYYFMPCFVNERPPAIVFSYECVIHYPFQDRHGAYWAIVSRRMILVPDNTKTISIGPNILLPALFKPEFVEDREHEYKVYLDDLDGKWIRMKKSLMLHLIEKQAVRQLTRDTWVENLISIYKKEIGWKDETRRKAKTRTLVLSLNTGLLR